MDDESNSDIYERYQSGDPAPQPAEPPPAPQPDWTAAATSAPNWSQADEIDLQRLTNGASYARNQLASGQWGQDTYAPIASQLNEQLGPLMQRKQSAEQFKQGQATQQALHGQAIEDGIRHNQMVTNARIFPKTVQELYNPNTGGIDRYYQSEPGKWQLQEGAMPEPTDTGGESDRPAGDQAEAPPVGPDGLPLTDKPRFRTVVGADGVPRQQRVPTLAERAAMDAATPEQQVGVADRIARGTFDNAAPDGGPMSVQNGQYTDQYQDGRLTGTNRPQSPSDQQPTSNFHQQAMAEVGPPPPQFYRGAHGQVLPNPQFGRWQQSVDRRAADLGKEHRQAQTEAARMQRDEQKRKADLTEKQRADLYGKEVDRMQKEIHDHRLHTKDAANVPDELKGPTGQYLTPSEVRAAAKKNVDDMMRHSNPEPQDQSAPQRPQLSKEAVDRLNRLKDADARTHAEVQARQRKPEIVNPGSANPPGISPMELFR